MDLFFDLFLPLFNTFLFLCFLSLVPFSFFFSFLVLVVFCFLSLFSFFFEVILAPMTRGLQLFCPRVSSKSGSVVVVLVVSVIVYLFSISTVITKIPLFSLATE